MVLAGSKGSASDAILTCEAVFRSGTGILLLGFPESLRSVYKEILPEAMTLELPETPSHSLSKRAEQLITENTRSCDVVVMGPGLSTNAETVQLVWELIFEIKKPLVLASDAITALTKGIEVMLSKETTDFLDHYLSKISNPLIMVLSPNEAAKLAEAIGIESKYTAKYIDTRVTEFIPLLASKFHATVVVTGTETVIGNHRGEMVINRLGCPKQAIAASEGVLSGIIGSFIGQNLSKPLEAVVTATYLYDQALIITKQNADNRVINASEIVRHLPEAIKKAENE